MLTGTPSDRALANWKRCHTLVGYGSYPMNLRPETMGSHNLAVSETEGLVGFCA